MISWVRDWYVHLLEERYLEGLEPFDSFSEVRLSGVAGRGVFATVDLPPGKLLGVYPGTKMPLADFKRKEFSNRSIRYAYILPNNYVLDPSDPFGYLPDREDLRLALVNEPPPGEEINTLPISSLNHLWYVTLREVPAGQELLTSYGSSYKRDYATAMNHSSASDYFLYREVLTSVSLRHPWLRHSVKMLLP